MAREGGLDRHDRMFQGVNEGNAHLDRSCSGALANPTVPRFNAGLLVEFGGVANLAVSGTCHRRFLTEETLALWS
jgi:hypothetical protein